VFVKNYRQITAETQSGLKREWKWYDRQFFEENVRVESERKKGSDKRRKRVVRIRKERDYRTGPEKGQGEKTPTTRR